MHFHAVLFSKGGRLYVTVINPDGSVTHGTPDFATYAEATAYAQGLDVMARVMSNGHARCLLEELADEVDAREFCASRAPTVAS